MMRRYLAAPMPCAGALARQRHVGTVRSRVLDLVFIQPQGIPNLAPPTNLFRLGNA